MRTATRACHFCGQPIIVTFMASGAHLRTSKGCWDRNLDGTKHACPGPFRDSPKASLADSVKKA